MLLIHTTLTRSVRLKRCAMVGLILLLSACASPHTQPDSELEVTPTRTAEQFVSDDGYVLPFLTLAQPSNPSAILIAIHGFNDYSQTYRGLCDYIVERDIACFAYDQRGFGATAYRGIWPQEGKHQSDLNILVGLLKSEYPDVPIYLAGESMGGAVILSAMTQAELSHLQTVAGVALFAPAVWARSTQPWYQRIALTLAVRIAPAWSPTGESLGVVATDNRDILIAMRNDPLIIRETRIDAVYGLTNLMDHALESVEQQTKPMLIMYGEKDEVIPIEPTCKMLAHIETTDAKTTFKLYPNGYHMLTRDLQAERVFEDVTAWIESRGQSIETTPTEKLCSKLS